MPVLQPYRSLPITRRGRPRVTPALAGATARRWLSASAVAFLVAAMAAGSGHRSSAATLTAGALLLAMGALDSWKARYAEPRVRHITAADFPRLPATLRAAAYGSSTLPAPPELPDRRPRLRARPSAM